MKLKIFRRVENTLEIAMEEIDHAPMMFELHGIEEKSTPTFATEFRLLLVDDTGSTELPLAPKATAKAA